MVIYFSVDIKLEDIHGALHFVELKQTFRPKVEVIEYLLVFQR
jgi:hypothetical protein